MSDLPRRLGALLVGSWCTLVAAGESGSAPKPRKGFHGPVRGITISTHGGGQDWGSDAMAPTLADIRALGAGWVAIHPYARILADGRVEFRAIDPAAPPAHVIRPILEAHALGLKILIIPHLAYWGSPFGWRGDIVFGDDASWERFWTSYSAWILELAAVARGADGFVVGSELDKTLGHEARWRALIRDVRGITDVPLTYAANWDRFEDVAFWDALDAIGIQGYFPLVSADEVPTEDNVRAAWNCLIERLNAYARRHDRPVVLTELGYNHSFNTAHEPWSYATDEGAEPVQALCTRVALETLERQDSVLGGFLWKWFPRPHSVGRNYRLATPAIQRVIREAWVGR